MNDYDPPSLTRRIAAEESGIRLSTLLNRTMGISWSAIKAAKWTGRILVNGVSMPVNHLLQPGDLVTFLPEDPAPAYRPIPCPMALNIPYEDEHLLIVSKPAPMATASGSHHPGDALENVLCARVPDHVPYVFRPMNRLDRGTSGFMAVAKTALMQHQLQQMLHQDGFIRQYLAVTEGIPCPPEGIIRMPIAKEDGPSIRRVIHPEGKMAVTRYETVMTSGSRALVRLQLETGRTHQIRVHLSYMGCPVCGDFLYGKELPELPGRFALHAWLLSLRHPITGETLCFTDPLPPALVHLLAKPVPPLSPTPLP